VIRRLRLLALLGCLLATSLASADDTNYRGIPIGAHAIGLGGAFTGVADDVSAAYFNPAGLSLGGTVGIAAGLSINAWEREDLRRAFGQPESSAVTATTKTSRTLPIFVGAVVKFGPKTRDGERRHALGISVVEPIFEAGGVTLKFRTEPVNLSDSYRVTTGDRGTWYGVSFASRLKRKHSIGASLYLSVRKLNHSETGLLVNGGMPDPDNPGFLVGTSTAANTQSLGFRAFHLVWRFGWLYQVKPQLRIGTMLQLPGIPVHQRVSVFSQGFVNDSSDPTTPASTDAYFFDQKVGANLPIPAELEVGLQYWPADKVMLAFDASLHLPTRAGLRVDSDASVPIGGLFFDLETQRLTTGNVAIAGDFFIGKIVAIEAGFFTDFSSALRIPENPDRYYSARINRLGGTISVGFNVVGISLAVGSTVIYGKGDATGVRVDLGNIAAGYARTEATSRIVYLHLTGATRAAEDVSKKAAERIKARQARRKAREGTADK
jgi:long-subunit fatty acid transport protein